MWSLYVLQAETGDSVFYSGWRVKPSTSQTGLSFSEQTFIQMTAVLSTE